MTSTAKVSVPHPLLTRDLTVGMVVEYTVGHYRYVFQITLLTDASTAADGPLIRVGYRFLASPAQTLNLDRDYDGVWAPDFPFMEGDFTIRPYLIEELPV